DLDHGREEAAARVYRRPRAFSNSAFTQAAALGLSIAEVMIREHPQVVQIATAYDGYLGLHLHRFCRLPYVVYAHGNEILDAGRSAWPKPRQSLQHAARVLAVSEFTAGLVRKLGVDSERIVVLHPGCDVERFQPRPASPLMREQILQNHSHDL